MPSDPSAYGLREYALDIDAVRAALGSESVHVLGHSWGGGLALTYAAAFPEHVASLTLIDNLPPRSDVFAAGSARFQARIAELMAAAWSRIRSPQRMATIAHRWCSRRCPRTSAILRSPCQRRSARRIATRTRCSPATRPRCGHYPWMDCPAETFRSLRAFYASVL